MAPYLAEAVMGQPLARLGPASYWRFARDCWACAAPIPGKCEAHAACLRGSASGSLVILAAGAWKQLASEAREESDANKWRLPELASLPPDGIFLFWNALGHFGGLPSQRQQFCAAQVAFFLRVGLKRLPSGRRSWLAFTKPCKRSRS